MDPREGLDERQAAIYDERLSALPSWVLSRTRRLTAVLVLVVVLVVGAVVATPLMAGDDKGFPALMAAAGSVYLIVAALPDPRQWVRYSARTDRPSKADLARAVSSYQIDGGRVPRPGEQPPGKYWDRWS